MILSCKQNQKMNIRFNYLYRDAANYKQFGSVVVSPPEGSTLEELDLNLKKHLIQEEFFVPSNLGIPNLQAFPYDPSVDHEWHEYEELNWTEEEVEVEGFWERVNEKGGVETAE
ncbi:hypothetical protein [Anditalea andensis]|uniref:Uncharacterized protein n=1 Tax=Anditalea andensis TaxID=1048983 RepID=A0A074KVN5_9BACT|nr:hypothetical protein [Anditalea andensis]KEO71628.1 hypothetical protein EL17_23950 [Anditalea andensis]